RDSLDLLTYLLLTKLLNIALIIDIIMDAMIATPKLLITKSLLITASVIINVIALITNKNKPSVKTVAGNVKITNIDLTNTFKINIITLANNAVPKSAK